MSVKIRDLLSLDLLRDANIFAGKSGLDNEIKRVNFTDCPMLDDIAELELIKRGDLFINSLYIFKENTDDLLQIFQYYIDCGSAGIIIIDEYLNSLPEKVAKLCNRCRYPAIFVNSDIPYAEIIRTAMEMILSDQMDTISEMRIDKLLDKNVSKDEIIKTARYVNKGFKKYYACSCASIENIHRGRCRFLNSDLNKNSDFESIIYHEGIFTIINFDRKRTFDTALSYIESLIKNCSDHYRLGVSSIFESVEDFAICIRQAVSAMNMSAITKDKLMYYNNLGTYKIIYPARESAYIRDFCDEVLSPLTEYDEKYKSDLIKTIEVYLQNDGDYKKTATDLNQHENTVRYRILKAKKLLNLEENNMKFIEQVSVALKIRNTLISAI